MGQGTGALGNSFGRAETDRCLFARWQASDNVGVPDQPAGFLEGLFTEFTSQILDHIRPGLAASVDSTSAWGRVLAEEVFAPLDLPL